MATTRPDIKTVKIENLNIWCDDTGNIHLTTDDPDARDLLKNTYLSNNPKSKRYHPTAYAQFAGVLRRFGKIVPDWEGTTAVR